jgi:hypothetical protein
LPEAARYTENPELTLRRKRQGIHPEGIQDELFIWVTQVSILKPGKRHIHMAAVLGSTIQ